MTTQQPSTNNFEYETYELKLAALILSEIPGCSLDVYSQGNSVRKAIRIKYPAQYKEELYRLERAFINKMAETNVYAYNKALNVIRDRLKGCERWDKQAK